MKISYIVLAIILLLGVIITGCNTDSIDAPAQDTDSVEDALVSPSYSTTLDNMLKEFRSSELTGAQAKDGDTVQVHYTGKLTDGTVFDSSVQREPLEFKLGAGQMIPGFERAVLGMKVGERKTVTIPAEEAYGPRNNNLVWEIALTQLPSGLNPQVGQALQLRQSDNSTVRVIVTAVSDNTITVDGNRPLAGKDLTFEIELVKIQ